MNYLPPIEATLSRRSKIHARPQFSNDISANSPRPSLRERKKQATREALIASARKLFAEKGYENTTLNEICDSADVHISTFFSYFESKEELAFAHTIEQLEHFRHLMANRTEGGSAIEAWWKFVDEYSTTERNRESAFMERMDEIPALRSRYASIVREYEDILAGALAKEAGNDPKVDLFSRLKAATILALMVAGGRWYIDLFGESGPGFDSVEFAKIIIERFPERKSIDTKRKLMEQRVRRHMGKRSTNKRTTGTTP